jgi:outer membrane protein assembly factor BamA
LFEDYKLVGGVRLAFDLQNNDFGVSFENLKGRIDKKFTAQRQAQTTLSDFNSFKVHTHALQYQWKYPFTELASLRLTVIGRQDRLVTSSTDPQSLVAPTFRQYQVGARLEYVFDNTVNRGLNLYNGTRYKVWVERYQRPDVFDQRSDFNILGFDFRHYEKIHRDLIFAFRFSGSTSFGRYKLAHYLGGVDNWLFQRVDNSLPGLDTAVFYHQTFMGPMRGFFVNARNGNSFALANAEIRWPVFKYFMKKPIKSDFIENFQIVTFFDAGSAWTGASPYSNENLFNRTTVIRNPITVEIENNKDPIVYGYGFGLRSRVLGYFLRADWAWGVDDRRVLPRVFYLSLNLDF